MSRSCQILIVAMSFGATATNAGGGNTDKLIEDAKARFGVLETPAKSRLDDPVVLLGQSLFWDSRFSANGKIACASCHLAADGGADRRRFSTDAREKLTSRNSQTVFNAVQQPSLRWTGDRKSGAHQAEKSLTGSMGFVKADDVVPLLKRFDYEPAFKKAFPKDANPVSPANYAKSIEQYESTLVTPAPFDRFLSGETEALTKQQRAGLQTFVKVGCANCHKGPLLGGDLIRKFGVAKDYWTATRSEKKDIGRAESTKDDSDLYKFRVSMLRNISKTSPYFHDGSIGNLKDAVQVMAEVQLGSRLNDADADAITSFLESLTGNTPPNYGPREPVPPS